MTIELPIWLLIIIGILFIIAIIIILGLISFISGITDAIPFLKEVNRIDRKTFKI